MSKTEQFISLEILAAKTRLPQKYLKELADKHTIPMLLVNGRRRFKASAVEKTLNTMSVGKPKQIAAGKRRVL